MLDILYKEGHIPVNGITYSADLVDYLLDKSNYSVVTQVMGRTSQVFKHLGISRVPQDWIKKIVEGYPDELREEFSKYRLGAHANYCEKGFSMLPHRDFFANNHYGYSEVGIGSLLSYVAPSGEPIGREFVYGKVRSPITLQENPIDWDDPRLEKLGEITPKTGRGVLVDALCGKWWHGVTPLLSEGPVISISMTAFQ